MPDLNEPETPRSARGASGPTTDRRRFMQATGAGVAGLAALGGTAGGQDVAGSGVDVDDEERFDVVEQPDEVRLLVVSVTQGYRHDSIQAGNEAIQGLSERIKEVTGADEVTVDIMDSVGPHMQGADPQPVAHEFPMTYEELEPYDAVIWNNTTHQILLPDGPLELVPSQRDAFEEYIRNGGGYVGIHAAADTHYDWEWYADLVGAQFENHPAVQEATLTVEDGEHPSTSHLPTKWVHEDEWYDWDENPRGDVNVLISVDEDTYDGAGMEGGRVDHPQSWCHEFQGGRSWYTNLGHRSETFEDEFFLEHLLGGILWSCGFVDGDANGSVWSSYKERQLTGRVDEPRDIAVAADGTVFAVQRDGEVVAFDTPDSMVERISVSTVLETAVWQPDDWDPGYEAIALDPDFEENGWLYLHYPPAADDLEDPGEPYTVVSRFTVENGAADPASEVELLRIPHQRERPAPSSCELAFGPGGDLFVATPDNVEPDDEGYAPLDERHDPNTGDARGTAADSSDLRGKLLRIRPTDDGSYEVPGDNMFTAETGFADEVEAGVVRPEIYAMGLRNPLQISVDPETGAVHVGDEGPSAEDWDTDRGPIGISEYHRIRSAGLQSGWPFVRGPGYPYLGYDYAEESPQGYFDPTGPANRSRHNRGLPTLGEPEHPTFYVPTDWETYTSYQDRDETQQTIDETWEQVIDTLPFLVGAVIDQTGIDQYVYEGPRGGWDPPAEAPYPELTGRSAMAGPVVRLPDDPAENALPAYMDGKWLLAEADTGTLRAVTFDDSGEVLEISPFLPEGFLPDGLQAIEVGPQGRLYYACTGEDAGVYQLVHNEADIELIGRTGGWRGVFPEAIEGETNPTIAIEAGTAVRLEWTNGDAGPHNFEILDDSGEAVVSTQIFPEYGGTQVVEFVATEDMVQYQCNPHSSSMNGVLEVSSEIDGISTLPYQDYV